MAENALDCVAFGRICDDAQEEHVLCIKRDANAPADLVVLCITAINTKLAQTLRCQLELQEEPHDLDAEIQLALAEGKINLESHLKEISIQLPDRKLTAKMELLVGNTQSEEIGDMSHSMMKQILKLKKTILSQSAPITKKSIVNPRKRGKKRSVRNLIRIRSQRQSAIAAAVQALDCNSSTDSD